MAEIPTPDVLLPGSGDKNGLNGKLMEAQKISVSGHMIDGVNPKSDSFIVDLESFSNGGGLDYDITPDSRISLQRSISRKGYHRGAVDCNTFFVAAAPPSSSSLSSSSMEGESGSNSMPEKASKNLHSTVLVPDESNIKAQGNHHHQIAMKTGNIISAGEGRWGRRYNSFKRSPKSPWFTQPKRVLLFFATLSSIGTMMLICFTLAITKPFSSSDWQP